MKWLNDEDIEKFLNIKDYDIRKPHNARWIDQKCTPDVLCTIADCVLEYSKRTNSDFFSCVDIWYNPYTIENIEKIYKKPKVNDKKAQHEYDKVFQQPMELFAYAGILEKRKKGKTNYYRVINENILYYLSVRERNCLNFLILYIEKVLRDSGIYESFEEFFKNPTKHEYLNIKNKFMLFTINNTKINGTKECNRIFTKVINPLAFKNNTKGSEFGRLSKNIITQDMLMYNRNNFRDIYVNKPKNMTRGEYYDSLKSKDRPNIQLIQYQAIKAKKLLKDFNNLFNDGKSEIDDEYAVGSATHMHHIFPAKEFVEISGHVENLIALTPNQHLLEAHPGNNTQIIDKGFQQICLLAKAEHIEKNIKHGKEVIYSFNDFIYVLTVGLNNNKYNEIRNMDFTEIIRQINIDYIDIKNG